MKSRPVGQHHELGDAYLNLARLGFFPFLYRDHQYSVLQVRGDLLGIRRLRQRETTGELPVPTLRPDAFAILMLFRALLSGETQDSLSFSTTSTAGFHSRPSDGRSSRKRKKGSLKALLIVSGRKRLLLTGSRFNISDSSYISILIKLQRPSKLRSAFPLDAQLYLCKIATSPCQGKT
jgi:hypothetical protein